MKRLQSRLHVVYFVFLTLLFGLAHPSAQAQTVYSTGFEGFTSTNWQGWSADNGVWQIGTPTVGPGSAYQGTECAATALSGTYPGSQSSHLISPAINLPSVGSGQQLSLFFWQWFSWAYGSSGSVQISTWSGTAWGGWTTVGPTYSGTSGGWDLASIDLTAYAGQQIRLGFLHVGYYQATGWYIDNVGVTLQATPYLPVNSMVTFENFTGNNWQGWSADNGVWQIGTPTAGPGAAYQGTQCAVTTLSGTYPGSQSSHLISPAINLPSVGSGQQLSLSFWQWFSWAYGSSGSVQVSTWSGTAWGAWTTVGPTYSGMSGGWDLASIDLTAYAGQQIRLGFLQVGYYQAAGWYIDDILVTFQSTPYLPVNHLVTFENFTGNNWNGWSADNGVWQIGTPTAGPGSAYQGTECAVTTLSGTYPGSQSSHLISPAINLPSVGSGQHLSVSFWQWFSWAYGSSGSVQVSTWSGTAWGAWTTVGPTYSGTSGGWDLASIDLTAYAGQQIRLGFLQVGYYQAAGWYIDDITVVTPKQVYWQDPATGDIVYMALSGQNEVGNGYISTVTDHNWKIVAAADLFHLGNTDIIWQNTATGAVVYWDMDQGAIAGYGNISTVSDLNWKIVATADLFQTGNTDLIWQNSATGDIVYWDLINGVFVSGAYMSSVHDLNWKIVATTDLFHIGNTDLIWQNSVTGDVVFWDFNYGSLVNSGYIASERDLSWKIVGSTDLYGTGGSDLIWQSKTTGDVVYWEVISTGITGSGYILTVPDLNWKIGAVR